MDELTKLFDVLLLKTAAYPITLWSLLFDPARLFQHLNDDRVCSASLTYVFTVLLLYAWLLAHQKGDKAPGWLTPTTFIAIAVAYVAIIVNIQQYAVSNLFDIAPVTLKAELDALVYAFCPTLLFVALVYAVAAGPDSNVAVIAAPLGGNALYVWCLYNVSSAAFHLSPGQALRSAFIMWGCFVGIIIVATVVGLVAAFLLSRAERPT